MALKILGGNGYTDWGWPSAIVGDPATALQDGDDATYLYTDAEDGWRAASSAIHLEALTGYESGDPISLVMRFSMTGGGTSASAERITLIPSSHFDSDVIGHFGDGDATPQDFFIGPPFDGSVRDLTRSLSLVGLTTTTADVVAALEAGAFLRLEVFRNANWVTPPEVRIHEAALHVGTAPTTVRAAPPLRCHPRDDGLGPGVGRSFPPPTSWQHGGRFGGGYH